MNEFDDLRSSDPDPSGGSDASISMPTARGAKDKPRCARVLAELLYELHTVKAVAAKLMVNESTYWRRLESGATLEIIEQMEEVLALVKRKRDETRALGYTIHGVAESEPIVISLKALTLTAVAVRRQGSTFEADEIETSVVSLVEEIKDAYPRPLEGKLLAIKASCQTGLGQLAAAAGTFQAAAVASEPYSVADAYRYRSSKAFLDIRLAFKDQDSKTLRQLLSAAEEPLPAALLSLQATEKDEDEFGAIVAAAKKQRLGILLVACASNANQEKFREAVKAMIADYHQMFEDVEAAINFIKKDFADNSDGIFDVAIKKNWLRILKQFS